MLNKSRRQGESPIVLDRVLFFSYASTTSIIVLEKTGAWRIAPVPDPDFTQAPARRTDRSDRWGCEVRQSMSTMNYPAASDGEFTPRDYNVRIAEKAGLRSAKKLPVAEEADCKSSYIENKEEEP
jgi:hypothetical protein